MRHRYLVSLGALAGVLALVSMAAVSMSGQSPKAAPLRTPWGDPDLQGVWFVMADVPLERSAANAGKEFLTDEEVAAADKQKGLNPGRNARSANAAQDVTGAYNAVFNSVLRTGKRTSMIIDPPDGKIPPLVAGTGGEEAEAGLGGAPAGGGRGAGPERKPGEHRAITALSRRSDAVPSAEHRFCPGHGDADRAVS